MAMTLAQIDAQMAALSTLMDDLIAAGPEGSVTGPNNRQYTLRNLKELRDQYDWLSSIRGTTAAAATTVAAAGGGAGVAEFGGPA